MAQQFGKEHGQFLKTIIVDSNGNEIGVVGSPIEVSGSISATNPSVSATAAAAPAFATEMGIIVAGNLVGVSAVNPVPVTGTISATNPSVGTTGAAAPTSATEIGVIDGSGNLQGASSSNPVRTDPTGTTIQPVSGTVTLGAGSAVVGHVIADSGSTTVVTGNVTVIQGTGTNLHTVVDSGSITVTQGTGTNLHTVTDSGSVTAATLSAETTKVIGTVRNLGNAGAIFDGAPAATAPANAIQVGGTFNTTPATLTNGQMGALQLDSAENLLVNIKTALPAGSNVIGHVIADSGSTTAVTGNVTVVQGTGTNLHTVIDSGTITAVTAITNALPAGSNVIGHVIADSGSTTVVTGTVTVAGAKTNNNAAPGATNVGALVNVANAAAPSWTEGNLVAGSVDLAGNQRVILTAGAAVIGHVITDSGSVTAATLSAETTKVIGTVRNLGNSGAIFDGAPAATAPANAIQVGATFNTTPATLTNGQMGALQLDSAENLLVNLKTALPAGSNVIGHVIADSGSTTVVTGNVTVVQATGTNLHAVIDSGSTTAVTGNVTVVQATGTNLHAVIDTGSTTAVTQATASNLNAQVQGAGASGAAKAGNPVQTGAVFNTTQPTVTTGQTVEAQATARGSLIVAPGVDNFAVQATLSAETTKVIGTTRVTGNIGGVFDGVVAATAPANAIQVAGADQANLLRPLSTDSFGQIVISPNSEQRELLYQILLELRAVKYTLVSMGTGPGSSLSSADVEASNFDNNILD